MYTPSLAIRKDLIDVLGSYFDEDIHWTEDSDLRHRIKAANIRTKYLQEAKVYHAPLTPHKDLRSAFRYGVGERIRVEKGTRIGGSNFIPVLKKFLGGSSFRYLERVIAKKGSLVALYMVLWNLYYLSGYYAQSILNVYNVPPNIRKMKSFFY
jgi:GT2 family glycosyltransferase